jgi:hypothetical protein
MDDLKKLQDDFANDQVRAANMSKYLRLLADAYEVHGSTELVAQFLSESLDGSAEPVKTKVLVENVRRGMMRLLLTVQLGWKERQLAGGHDGN